MLYVVAGIIESEGKVLLCQRHRNSKRFPLKWEFPGGKVEANESPENAIARELKEELDIECRDIRLLQEYDFAYQNEKPFHLFFFRIGTFSGTIKNLQFEKIAWVGPESISGYDLLEGDKPFLQRVVLNL